MLMKVVKTSILVDLPTTTAAVRQTRTFAVVPAYQLRSFVHPERKRSEAPPFVTQVRGSTGHPCPSRCLPA